jgi:saccharopine dehydrogenase-like NADP-dependent oxidoreductase
METKQNFKNILILGSGMMVEPLIDYLLKSKINKILVATNMLDSAKQIVSKKGNSNLSCDDLDVIKDKEKLNRFVRMSDIVISYLPPVLHIIIAEQCLKERKHMVTTSYVSEAMGKLDEEVRTAGLTFMNEIGLDPGIDHLITHKVINEAKKNGDKIVHYESWCGALCSPEFLDNPLFYKFTWSPRGALLALKNNAKQLVNNKIVEIPSNELLVNTNNKNFQTCFNFEGYFNRDSLPYKSLYQLEDAETVIRGTIRFKGFAFIMQCMKNLNLFEDVKLDENTSTWKEYFDKLINDRENSMAIQNLENTYLTGNELLIIEGSDDQHTFYTKVSLVALSKFSQEYIKANNFNELFGKIYSVLKYLDISNKSSKLKSQNVLDSFALLMEEKLKMQEWERDMVFMQNEFKLKTKTGKVVNKKYDIVVFGGHNGMPYSAVSLLVSMPCAVATQLILDGKIKEKGVLRPTTDIIIQSVLEQVEYLLNLDGERENICHGENRKKS